MIIMFAVAADSDTSFGCILTYSKALVLTKSLVWLSIRSAHAHASVMLNLKIKDSSISELTIRFKLSVWQQLNQDFPAARFISVGL